MAALEDHQTFSTDNKHYDTTETSRCQDLEQLNIERNQQPPGQ